MPATMETCITSDKVIISFPPDALPQAALEDFISFLKCEWTVRQSHLTGQEAFALAEEVGSSWWKQNRQRILQKIGEA